MTPRQGARGRGPSLLGSARSVLSRRHAAELRIQLAGRRAATVTVIGLSVFGAALGALAGADPRPPGRTAEVSVVVDPRRPGLNKDSTRATARLRYFEGFARRPEVLAAAGYESGFSARAVAQRTEARLDEAAGILRVSAREDTVANAGILAAAVANQIVASAQRATRSTDSRTEVLGDFEAGKGPWTALSSGDPLPTRVIDPREGDLRSALAFSGTGFLRVTCRPATGCGVMSVNYRLLNAATPYRVSARARVRTGRPAARLVSRLPSGDTFEGQEGRLGRRWSRISAAWRPSRSAGSVRIALEVDVVRRSQIDVDAVTLVAPGGSERLPPLPSPLVRASERSAIEKGQYATVTSPADTGISGRLPGAETLAGAGAGLLVAASSIGSGAAAARRRRRQRVQP